MYAYSLDLGHMYEFNAKYIDRGKEEWEEETARAKEESWFRRRMNGA